jgi:hypothetical protein
MSGPIDDICPGALHRCRRPSRSKWNARLVTVDALTAITGLEAEDGGPMDVGSATLAAAAIRALQDV